LNHSSYIQTGLFELENDGFLSTNVVISFAKRLGTIRIVESNYQETNQPHPKTSFYQLTDKKSGRKINFATDLYDASNSFSKYALEHCDYVFKRNFETKYIEKLPKEYQNKLFPLGLTFGTRSKYQKHSFKFLFGLLTNLRIAIKNDSLVFKRVFESFRKQIAHWQFTRTTRLIDNFEHFEVSEDNIIFFQTRCFFSELQSDVKEIHQQRFHLILILKQKFKDKFKGGIIPSPIANRNYKEALTNLPTDPVSYLNLLKKAKIVIYTRGLAYSPAWKMAEYLSQGKVIIAEKLTAELLVSLEHGKEVLFFENDQELISQIEEVLKNDVLSQKLSENAKKYFENHVHPKQNTKRIINFMLAQH
jgi:glycosyltransferase involved in cell wall biosynthesis